MADYATDFVNTTKGKAVILKSEKSSFIHQKGAPELPKYTKSIIVPENSEIKISIAESKFTEIKDILIAPSKGILSRENNPADVPFEYGEQYVKDEMFPSQTAILGETYILRNFNGQAITVYPFQYNPVKKILRIYEDLVIEIIEKAGKEFNIEPSGLQKIDREFSRIYNHHFLNYGFDSKYTPLEEEGRMLVVCHTNYMEAMQPFADWKNQRGLHTELIEFSTIGTTATQLKDYVTNYYNTNGLTYLLLVGDSEHIPSLQKSGDSDAAYGHILGDDSYAEVFVGRFSAQSVADVETQVQRTLFYEKELGSDASWLSKAIGIASDEGTDGEGDDGESDHQHMDNIRADLLNYGYNPVEQIYDPGASSSTLSTKINEGVGLIDYIGHGSDYAWATTGFSTSHVNNLANENMLPFIFDVACVNGNFHGRTCFAESWMRASKNSNPTGAIAIIASTINQSWSSPMDAQDEMIDILTESYIENIKRTFGGITVNGIMHMIDEYGSDGSDMANTWTIFGDPSLLVRTKAPSEITITHPTTIVAGNAQITITGDDNVFVSLTIDNEIIATGKIENDILILDFESITEPTTLVLTATGYNKVTQSSEINVVSPTTPYVVKDLIEINDLAGNNNSMLEYGETAKLNVRLKNITQTFDAYEVAAKFLTTDSNVIVLDSLESFGTILKDTISLIDDAFELEISEKITDQQKINCTLEISGKDSEENSYIWISNVHFTLNAPKIEIEELIIDDKSGDNNGVLDPGETATLKLIVKNNGHAAINGMSGLVEKIGENDDFVITNATTELFNLDAGASDTIDFIVFASDDGIIGTPVDLKFTITDNNYSFYSTSKNKTITIGEIPEYLISDGGNHTITINSLFYDSGGEASDYMSNENYTITFSPGSADKKVKVFFTHFDIEPDGSGCYDYLSIYDGETTSAEKIGDFCSANPPSEIIASNTSGALTFRFISDSYVEESGWKGEISLVSFYTVKFVVTSSGNAVENALVSFNSLDKRTDSNGEVIFNDILSNVSMTYIVRKPGFENETGIINVSSDINKDVVLFEGIAKYFVEFIVTDGTNAVSGATINFDDQQGTTDAQGKLSFAEISYGLDKRFIVSKDSYFQYIDSIDVDTNLSLPVTMSLEKYSVIFNVTSSTNSTPLQGVQINFNSALKVTDSYGNATFNNIEPKTDITYSLSKTGYESVSGNLDVVNEDKTMNIIMSVISSVNDLHDESFSIYPNPSQGIVTIDLGKIKTGNSLLRVYNISGINVLSREILVKENTKEIIDLSDQPKGIYFISVKTLSGEHFSRKILLK